MAHPPYHVFMSAAPSEKPTPRVFRSDCPRCRGTGWRKQRVLPVLLFVLSIGIFWLGFLACWKLLSGDVPSGDGHDALAQSPRILAAPLMGVACLVGSWQSRRLRCNCDEDEDEPEEDGAPAAARADASRAAE